jgi:hypothetical protein
MMFTPAAFNSKDRLVMVMVGDGVICRTRRET